MALELDVTDPEGCERFVEMAGPADALVNNMGSIAGRWAYPNGARCRP